MTKLRLELDVGMGKDKIFVEEKGEAIPLHEILPIQNIRIDYDAGRVPLVSLELGYLDVDCTASDVDVDLCELITKLASAFGERRLRKALNKELF